MNDRVTFDLPAGPHTRFHASAAASLVGQDFDLDERIAGLTRLMIHSLSADQRGLWTHARIVDAHVVREGRAIRVTVEAV